MVKGNGKITSRTVTTAPYDYDAVEGKGLVNIELIKGSEGAITVRTDANIQPYVVVEVKDGRLIVRLKDGIRIETEHGIKVTVPFEDLHSIRLKGLGNIATAEGSRIEAEGPVRVRLEGMGNVSLAVAAPAVTATLEGMGNITLAGQAHHFRAHLKGMGNLTATELTADVATVGLDGAGNIKVNARDTLNARINGLGNLKYKRHPGTVLNVKKKGLGKISPL